MGMRGADDGGCWSTSYPGWLSAGASCVGACLQQALWLNAATSFAPAASTLRQPYQRRSCETVVNLACRLACRLAAGSGRCLDLAGRGSHWPWPSVSPLLGVSLDPHNLVSSHVWLCVGCWHRWRPWQSSCREPMVHTRSVRYTQARCTFTHHILHGDNCTAPREQRARDARKTRAQGQFAVCESRKRKSQIT